MADSANYVVYIATNAQRSKLYIDITGYLEGRLYKLELNSFYTNGHIKDHECKYLLYCESYIDINIALNREKELKKLSFKKKKALIDQANPEWLFLNREIGAK